MLRRVLKNPDILAGVAILVYTILVVILREQGIADLGAYLSQPELSGPIAMVALARGYAGVRFGRQRDGGK